MCFRENIMRRPLGENFEKNLVSGLHACLALLMLAAAVCRHLVPPWHPPLLRTAGGCLAWLASLGMARAAVLGMHIKVSFLRELLPERDKPRLRRFADVVFLLFTVVSFGVGCLVFVLSFTRDAIPGHPLSYAAIPAGSALTAFRLQERLRAPRNEKEGT